MTTKLINKKTQKIVVVSEKHAQLILATGSENWARLELENAPATELQDEVVKLRKELSSAKGKITKLNKQIEVLNAVTPQTEEVKTEDVKTDEVKTEEVDEQPKTGDKPKNKKNKKQEDVKDSDNDELDELIGELD